MRIRLTVFRRACRVPVAVFIIALPLLACFGLRAEAQATYNFVGIPFSSFPANGGQCALPTCQLSGSFTVPQTLAPNMSQSVSGSGTLTPSSFSFTDGETTITNANASSSSFAVDTDASGNITEFGFSMSSTSASFSALYTGLSGSTSESDIYTGGVAFGGSITASGVSGGTWCLSFPPNSSQTSTSPCYLSSSILNFGEIAPGSSTSQQGITVGNPASAPLVISNIAIGAGYTQTNNCSTVAPGGSCRINVTFSPSASGYQNALLTITDDAANSPQTVYLDGEAFDTATASVSIASSVNPSALGQSVTFTATVTGVSPLNGKFEFFDGDTSLGLSTVDSNGTGTLTTSGLTAGTHKIGADYEATDGSSVGELPLQQMVTAAAPSFTMTLSPTTTTVADGSSVEVTVTLTPQNGFASPILLSCGTLPTKASCIFNPQTVTPGTSAATSQLEFTTTAPITAKSKAPTRPWGRGLGGEAWAGIALAALLWTAPGRWRGRRRWTTMVFAGAFISVLLSGCGAIQSLINQYDPGTPKGAATVQVTATSGSGASAVVQTSSFTVTVQ